ncbi:hypothetical protein N7456_000686 [Penicillium angulare]|uniref:Zn(2)-C6 fungal-type domain-containing protein n=1 Tax=Penicillium angulare TaxID=116970 RepID=A0A9W9GCH9_9EURO|nr:hypothetical protein N7456_000686 [Penicillium angulare]
MPVMDSPSDSPKPYSCVVCHKRKVKCDRKEPCSNCAKTGVECIYRPPPPPRRRKREPDASGDASQEREKSLRRKSPESPQEVQTTATKETSFNGHLPGTSGPKQGGSGRMIVKEGNSVYLDNTLWTSVSHELANATEVLDDEADNHSDALSQEEETGEELMLMRSATKGSLTDVHPNPLHIFKLWQTFLENVNPLIKVLHTPTLQPQILEAASDLPNVGKELEALMFTVYCIALVSLQPGEVEKSFGESKKKLLARCRRGAQMALSNASFLRTSSLMVLQAVMLYILSMRAFSDPHTIWTMSGVAMRIAQRIGIHRDGSGYGVSVFETEIRRRLWFQLVIIDSTSAQFCGVASNPLPATADTQPPLNINDSDLDPRMTEPPSEKQGPTEMMFCLTRSEYGKWLRRWSKNAGPSHSPWGFLSSPTLSLKDKDRAIDELENAVEQKFLKYCDRSIPLHLATIMMGRSVLHYTRLLAHHPRQYQDKGFRISQTEKDIIFENCFKMTEYANYTQLNADVQRFSWHTVHHMPWDAMIFMLSEMRFRTDAEEKVQTWAIIGNIYSRHVRQRRKGTKLPLHRAMENLMLKAWKAYVEECNNLQRTPAPCPAVVINLLSDSKVVSESQATGDDPNLASQGFVPEAQSEPIAQLDESSRDFDFLFSQHSPMDWNEWDDLLNHFQESLMDDTALMATSTS